MSRVGSGEVPDDKGTTSALEGEAVHIKTYYTAG